MGDVVNLNKFRKERARAQKKAAAASNRARAGQTKAEMRSLKDEKKRQDKHLDDHLPGDDQQNNDAVQMRDTINRDGSED
ncbi:MAG: DUF4169 family protein [Pseudomonadota bacterium]